MEKEIYNFGPSDGLNFAFEFRNEDANSRPLLGRLCAWIGGSLVWGSVDGDGATATGVEWYWQDLLRHLTEILDVLNYEEAYPLGLEPSAPQLLRQAARARWYGFSEERIEEEEDVLVAFDECHDLAHAASGIELPTLYLLREGAGMVLASRFGTRNRPAAEVIECLVSMADFMAARAERSSSSECQAVAALWRLRQVSVEHSERAAELASSLPRDRLGKIAGGISIARFWNLEVASANENAYLIAARMTSGLMSDEDMSDLMNELKVATTIPENTPRFDGISLSAISVDAVRRLRSSQQAYSQGYSLAVWLRDQLSMSATDRVDVQATLIKLGVTIWDADLCEVVDAILLWRGLRPPVIIANKKGKRSHFPKGRRSSLAHELCHLLVDRQGAFPVIEIQGGRVPRWPEQRANAFAAEFLLPRSAISTISATNGKGIASLLDHLSDAFDVSHELSAWQVLNSGLQLTGEEGALIKSYTHKSGLS